MIGAIILGLLAGYVAKALMPGKDPGVAFSSRSDSGWRAR